MLIEFLNFARRYAHRSSHSNPRLVSRPLKTWNQAMESIED